MVSGQTGGQTTIDIIYALMQKNPEITRVEMGKETGKSPSYIQRCIETLKKKNKIRRIGSKTFGDHWEVIEDNSK